VSRPLLSAAMIMRDEALGLPDCLSSLQDVADEVVIVDTGSVDGSVELARSFGAHVLQLPWRGSFSEPRNLGLEHVRGDWVLYVDADERVRPIARERLVERLQSAREVALRILLRPFAHATPYFEYRLWRNDPRIRFRGVMHERVVDDIKLVGVQDRMAIGDWPELALDHVGYDGDQRAKHGRNLPLLEEQLRREPGNVYNWRHLGQVLGALARYAEADAALVGAVELARLQDPPTGDGSLAWGELVRHRHDRGHDVRQLLAEGRERWPEQWQLVWIEAHVHLDAGRLAPAEQCFRRLLEVDVEELPVRGVAYDERIFGAFSLESLGLTLFRQGRYREAAEAYTRAQKLDPTNLAYEVKRVLAEARAQAHPGGICT
jgi:tetratricopeptide (TPR) repeat protein